MQFDCFPQGACHGDVRNTLASFTGTAGLGMGLMICRTIIESHGGSIRLLPTRHGTAFRFTLRAED